MTTSYRQTDAAPECGYVDTPEEDVRGPVAARCDLAGVPGVVELRPIVADNGQYEVAVEFELSPGLVVWPSGGWTVRWNVTDATPDVEWRGVRIYRTRGCQIVDTIAVYGSSAAPVVNVPLTTTGVKVVTVPASSVSQSIGAPDDRALVACVVATDVRPERIWGITPDQLIDTPLAERANAVRGAWHGGLAAPGAAGRLVSA